MCSQKKGERAWKNQFLMVLAVFFLQFHLWISVTLVVSLEIESNVYIVYMGEKQHEDPATTEKSHHNMLSNLLRSKEAAKDSILYSYRHGFSGFAARMTEFQAEIIADFPGVVRVIPNRIYKLHTTRSWDFLGLNYNDQKNLLSESNMGEGVIIGVIDTGVWPESKSFKDENMGSIPSRWKGICQKGELFNSSNCNRKLIGARWFAKGFLATKPTKIKEYMSPRDYNGHGTHTASTAAGRLVDNASSGGLAAGAARGGAPLAWLAVYKACWNGQCNDVDLLKAFDMAIHDGVDIVSVSIGGSVPELLFDESNSANAIGSFHATAKGITVVCSAGNDGPGSQTITNSVPWLINVAATTIDRAFPTGILLGNNHTLLGQSMYTGKHKGGFSGLVYCNTDDSSNKGGCNQTMVAGKIVLVFSETESVDDLSSAVKEAGGVGLIYAKPRDDGLRFSVSCEVPCLEVDYEVGTEILSYITKTRSPIAMLSRPRTVVGEWVYPRVAYFSSRGPSASEPAVLKPDISAPGVNILAAYPPHGGQENSHVYAFDSGTSMACPHVSGVAALIKSLHKDWSPAAIKSALVTTASQTDANGENIIADGATLKPADPFDIGGGQVNPNRAANPGLIYNISKENYAQFLCSIGFRSLVISHLVKSTITCKKNRHPGLDLNLPSISIPNLKKSIIVFRTLTNVGPVNSVYKALVQSPQGVKMVVEPPTLSFNSTTSILTFKVTFTSNQKVLGVYSFGSLSWTDGEHVVRSPIAVRSIKFESYSDI